LIFRPQAKRFLVIGRRLDPKRFWRDYPEMTVAVAELNPWWPTWRNGSFRYGKTRGCGLSLKMGGTT